MPPRVAIGGTMRGLVVLEVDRRTTTITLARVAAMVEEVMAITPKEDGTMKIMLHQMDR